MWFVRHLEILIYCSFNQNDNDDYTANSFDEYYLPLLEIINAIIDNKTFLDQPVKKTNKKCIKD